MSKLDKKIVTPITRLEIKAGAKFVERVAENLRRKLEAGARHSKSDQEMLQTMHDHAVSLGAKCGEQA